jgi:hypothetical protein
LRRRRVGSFRSDFGGCFERLGMPYFRGGRRVLSGDSRLGAHAVRRAFGPVDDSRGYDNRVRLGLLGAPLRLLDTLIETLLRGGA